MLPRIVRGVKLALAGLFMTGLAGCAIYDSIPYPKIGSIKKIDGQAMSPAERDKTIHDMEAEQQQRQNIVEKPLKKN
jgi:uncharacterized membrane protein